MKMRFLSLLPFLLLGPITGPLAAGAASCLRQRRFAMAAWYAAGIVEFWLFAPALLAWLIAYYAAHAHH